LIHKLIMLMLLSCFYLAYFAKQLSLKKQGINTNRLAKGSKPKRTQLIELCLLFITYAAAVLQFLSVLLSADFNWQIYRTAGSFLMFSGVAFFLLAIIAMRSNWRAGIDEAQKTDIVSTGIYRFSRNPAFVGFDLLYIGTALACPNIFMIVFAAVAVTTLHLQILEEEKYLAKEFGGKYLLYKNKTARYIVF